MVGRSDDKLVAGYSVNPEVLKRFQAQSLDSVGNQDHLGTADLDHGAFAQRDLRDPKLCQ